MNQASINNSDLFFICMCCVSSIYGLTVTTDSTEISREAIYRHGYGIERLCVYCGAAILDIWSPSGMFYWWIERELVGSQKEYLGWHMINIE